VLFVGAALVGSRQIGTATVLKRTIKNIDE
jgi:hypothetical protein